jgi:hypothetical protein
VLWGVGWLMVLITTPEAGSVLPFTITPEHPHVWVRPGCPPKTSWSNPRNRIISIHEACLTCKNKRCVHLCNFQAPPAAITKDRAGEKVEPMATCQICRSNTVLLASHATLFQIRHGYRAWWNELAFTVESASGDWTLRRSGFDKKRDPVHGLSP